MTADTQRTRHSRNWCCEGKPFFRGLRTSLSKDVKIVYVVDAQKMRDSEDHAERVPTPSSNHLYTHRCTHAHAK
jgi:hypothetical protein